MTPDPAVAVGGAHGTLVHVERRRVESDLGDFTAEIFQNLASGDPVLAVTRGDVTAPAPLLARVHSSCVTSEVFGGCDCDCAGQLEVALRLIARAGRGVVFYLMQEGRGAGLAAKARDRMLVQASRNRLTTFEAYELMGLGRDHRYYEEAAFACRLLGIRAPLRLLSNNPEKVAALEAEKLTVAEVVPLQERPSPFSLHYLESKSRSGHALIASEKGSGAAALPEPVEYFDPHPLAAAPRFLRVASYLLPVRVAAGSDPHWFWVHLYFDCVRAREQVVLTYDARGERAPLLRVQPERILERLPLTRRRRPGWREVAARVVSHGAGCVAFLPPTLEASPVEGAGDPDLARLLVQQLGGRSARLALDGAAPGPAERSLEAALEAAGASLASPVALAP